MADFNISGITKVEPGEPIFNNAVTKMEGMKKKARVKSPDPDQQFTVIYRGIDDTKKDEIMNHHSGQYGDASPFYWRNVPTYINSGTDMYVRYNSIETIRVFNNLWEVTIVFDAEII